MHKNNRPLREELIKAEQLLWNHLKMRQIEGFKFGRQQLLAHYMVDFVCFEKRLIIEIDVGKHAGNEKDMEREKHSYFIKNGFKILIFRLNDVFTNIECVVEVIRRNCLHPTPYSLLYESVSVEGAGLNMS